MRIDEGDIAGGFERSYDAWTVEDANTPIIRSIAASTGLRLDNSVTVEVALENGTSWTRRYSASFSEGLRTCIFTTPNPQILGVRIRGVVFAVDVAHPDEPVELDILPVACAASDVTGGRMFLASDTEVYAFDGVRVLWESRRVSLDGIRDLSYFDGQVRGVATDVGVDAVPFNVDAETGKAEGGFEGWRGFQRLDD
jgi:hypothetical protein